jgi:hypothetical protein
MVRRMHKVAQAGRRTKRLCVGAALGCFATIAVAAPFEVGQPLPDLVLPALEDGRPSSFAELRGTRLALQVFASW